jgi:hypothetical protein
VEDLIKEEDMGVVTKRVVSAAISGAKSTRKASHMVIIVIRYKFIYIYIFVYIYSCIYIL